MNNMNKIEVGQTLSARSACDHDCIFTAQVIARGGSFVTVRVQGSTNRVKVKTDADGEFIFAMGRFSMAPIFRPGAR